MIRTKEDLKEYIAADRARYNFHKSTFIARLFGQEGVQAFTYLRCLRHLEYHLNCRTGFALVGKIKQLYYKYRLRHLSIRYGIQISPNVVGKGLYIPHIVGGGDYQRFKYRRKLCD